MRHSFRYGLDYRPAGPYRSQMQTEAPTGRDSNVADRIAPVGLSRFNDGVTQEFAALHSGLSNSVLLGLRRRFRHPHAMYAKGVPLRLGAFA